MYLLHSVLVKPSQIPVFLQSVLFLVVSLQTFQSHAVVYDKEASFYLDSPYPGKIEQGIFHIIAGDLPWKSRQRIFVCILDCHNRKLHKGLA